MWRAEPALEANRIARYWDDLVTGALAEREDADLDPTLVKTIAWLERVDDAQPASAEFSRQFELQFLQTVSAAPVPEKQQAGNLIAFPGRRGQHQDDHGGLPLPGARSLRRHRAGDYGWDEGARRILVSVAAAVLLVVSLAAVYYAFERHGGTRDPNVILAPSSDIDVPMDRGNAQRSGVMPGPGVSGDLTVRWSFEAGRDRISAPTVVGDSIFLTSGSDPIGVSADQGSVIAIDATTGFERWQFPVGHAMGATPAVAGGIVYAGDAGGIVYALDARTGEERWRKELPSGWTSEPVVVGDAVFFAAASNQAPIHVATQDGTIVVGSGFVGQPADGFRLYSFDRLTGEERWRSGDDLSGQPGLFAFDAESGTPAWHFEMPSLESGPAIDGHHVFAGSTLDATIYSIDLASGEETWRSPIGEDLPLNSSPAVSGGSVFVTTAFGTIVCLDESTGEVRWQASAEHASLYGSAVVVGNTVYVVDTAYGVSALSAADGAVLWSEPLDLTGQVAVSPVVVSGTLYIGTSLEANTAYVATLWALAGSEGR